MMGNAFYNAVAVLRKSTQKSYQDMHNCMKQGEKIKRDRRNQYANAAAILIVQDSCFCNDTI